MVTIPFWSLGDCRKGAKIADPTPHWNEIGRSNVEVHTALQRVAGAIYEATEEPVYLDADEPGLSGALDLGYLERNQNGISFSDPEVAREYLARHTVDLLLQDWDVLDRFADTFQDARYRTLSFGTRQQVVSLVLLVLADEHSKDVVGRMGSWRGLTLEVTNAFSTFGICTIPFARHFRSST